MGNVKNTVRKTDRSDLDRYLSEVRSLPMLTLEEEQDLAHRWRDQRDEAALSRLVGSHLRLVVRIARGFGGYGLPLPDLIAEGNVGLMQAAQKFDPDRGFRFATYALWWIRAAVQEYVLRSWSIVRGVTTASQKKLFFNLRRLKNRLRAYEEGDLSPEVVRDIARELAVPEADVVEMNRRMTGFDRSLDQTIGSEGDTTWQDLLRDERPDQEIRFAAREEHARRLLLMESAISGLKEREQRILRERHLSEAPMTLQELSEIYGVSRERVRQIEANALRKVERAVREAARAEGLLEGAEALELQRAA